LRGVALQRYNMDTSNIKLLVTIKTSPKHAGRQAAIQETWAQDFKDHGAQVFFTVSDPKVYVPSLEGDFLKLPGEDSHRGLVTRMIWLMQYLQNIDFTHLVTIDDDCSVNVPLFMTLPWKTAEMYGNNNGGYLAGCCTVWSKEAATQFKRWGSLEDVCVGQMAKWFNIEFTGSENNAIRPWIKNNEDYRLTENVAVQHYSRTPEQIRENHKISLTLNKK
jgi:hypothetical protein